MNKFIIVALFSLLLPLVTWAEVKDVDSLRLIQKNSVKQAEKEKVNSKNKVILPEKTEKQSKESNISLGIENTTTFHSVKVIGKK